jgi:hypothetical protein
MMRLSCALLRSFGRHHVASPRLPSSAAALLKISFAPRGLVTVAARASPSRSAASVPQSLSARIISCGLKTYRNKPSPKPIKTKSCVKKRIRVSGKGLIKFKRAGMVIDCDRSVYIYSLIYTMRYIDIMYSAIILVANRPRKGRDSIER